MEIPVRFIQEKSKGEENDKNKQKKVDNEYKIQKSEPIISKYDTTKSLKESTQKEQ